MASVFDRTHDLARLAQQVVTSGIELPVGVEQVAELTPWAVELRYDERGLPDRRIAARAIASKPDHRPG